MNFILLDSSYLIFYRYFAIKQWWSHAHSENPLPENAFESEELVEKFTKIFQESILTIKKKLKLYNKKTPIPCTVIAARDCPRDQIWRNDLFSTYKESREKKSDPSVGLFFKHVYNNDLLFKAGADYIMRFPNLEGDDIIAITKNYIREKYPEADIYIITNDHDMLQLMDENTHIINLQYKNLRDNKKVFPEADKNLFFKIILGDKSDDISPVFSKCGPKTAEKYYENREDFEKALDKEGVRDRYELNKKIVSFSEIPRKLVDAFIQENREILDGL